MQLPDVPVNPGEEQGIAAQVPPFPASAQVPFIQAVQPDSPPLVVYDTVPAYPSTHEQNPSVPVYPGVLLQEIGLQELEVVLFIKDQVPVEQALQPVGEPREYDTLPP